VSLLLSPLDALAERVGLARASELLCVALTHSSYAAEHECESNERLEFLGDAVVDLAVADLIVTAYPALNEGSGSLVRSRVVNESSLAEAATRLDLASAMRIGRGVKKEHGLERPSLLADAFEAVVAAIYLENGYDAAKALHPRDPRRRRRRRRDAPRRQSIPRPGFASGPRRTASARRTTR
jgi:ribonuclease-3